MEFFKQGYWSRFPCSPLSDFLDPGVEPMSLMSPALEGVFFITSATWEAPRGKESILNADNTRDSTLGWEDSLKEGTATQSSILAWEIPSTEDLCWLQSMGSQRVENRWSDWACIHALYVHGFHVLTFKWPWIKIPSVVGWNHECEIHKYRGFIVCLFKKKILAVYLL